MTDSYTRVLEPDVTNLDDPGLLVVWGLFWVSERHESVVFCLKIDSIDQKLDDLQIARADSISDIERIYAEGDFEKTRSEILAYLRTEDQVGSAAYRQIKEKTEETVKNINWDKLDRSLRNEESDTFEEWVVDLCEEIIPVGHPDYTISGQVVSRPSEDSTPEEPQTEDTSDTDDMFRTQQYLRISPVTELSGGTLAKELREGDQVLYRVIDNSVRFMSDSMLDPDRDNEVTVPIKGVIKLIILPTALPDDFDGHPESYRQILIHIDEGVTGVGYVQQNELVRVEHDINFNPLSTGNLLVYLLLAGVSLSVAALLIFFLV